MDGEKQSVSHSVFRLGYLLAPPGMLDEKNIAEAKRALSSEQFNREYNAVFTDESGGFYNIQHIRDATVPVDQEPKLRMKGKAECEYIVAVDPNSSAGSEEADNFAISVLELATPDAVTGVLVHSYATAKSEVKKRVAYMRYLMKNFRVVFVILDNAGGPRFLEEFNALVPPEEQIFLAEIDFSDNESFRMTKREYDPKAGKIAFSQVFNKKNWIRDANEMMQGDIQWKRLMFCSTIEYSGKDQSYNANIMADAGLSDVDLDQLEFKAMSDEIIGEARRLDHVLHVDKLVRDTAKELALIEVKVDAVGNYTFDLPSVLKKSGGKDRARHDSYTSLLLANCGRRYLKRLREENDDGEIFAGFFVS